MTTTRQTQDSSMTAITTVEFERPTLPSETYLAELGDDGPPYTIHGVALGAGDVTKGKSGIKKKWPAEELQKAADSLTGQSLVVNHTNTAGGVVGKVTKAGYKDGVGVVYEAELYDEDLADKIKNDLLEVSVRGLHDDVDALSKDEESGAILVEGIEFKNLSIVSSGASPSNTLQMGEHAELSAAELSSFTDTLDAAELQEEDEPGPGDWVKWGDKRGIIMSAVEDGEVEVDIYEKSGDKWRSVEETEMVSLDDLAMWDVDEEEVGPPEDSEEDDGESEEEEDDSDDEEEAEEDDAEKDVEENSAVEEGQFVKWKDSGANWKYGQIIDIEQDDQQFTATLRRFTESGDKLSETAEKPVQGLDMWDDAPLAEDGETDSEPTESDSEDSDGGADPQQMSEGDMVEWQVNSDMFGEIVHVDEREGKIMVEVMRQTESGVESTNHTVTAGFSDLVQMDEAEMASTTKDVPTQDAQPDHEPMGSPLADAMEGFVQEKGSTSSIQEFVRWLQTADLQSYRGEGEEETLDDKGAREKMRRNSEERFLSDEVEEEELSDSADEGDEASDVEEPSSSATQTENGESGSTAELQDYEMHTPDWSGTTESDWSTPDLEDFDTDDLSEVANHFLISSSGFPPENFTDLKLPVVEPNGDLNVNALAAVKGGRGVTAVDGLGSDMEQEIVEWVNSTANEEFDKDWGNEEEEMADDMNVPEDHRFGSKEDAEAFVEEMDGLTGVHQMEFDGETMWVPGADHDEYVDVVASASKHGDDEDEEEMQSHSIEGTSGRPTPSTTVGGVRVLSGDDLQQGYKSEESDADSLSTHKVTNMNEEIEQKLAELSEPVAVEAEELQELQDKADRFEELSENIEALRERTEILDEVDREAVEELRDGDDPVVVESARYEELESEAEQVKGVYAASLAEEMPAFEADELSDRYSIEELREKHEEVVGSVEEELSSSEDAEPRSQDPSEEELEEASESPDKEEEELADEAEAKREEIRDKIFN